MRSPAWPQAEPWVPAEGWAAADSWAQVPYWVQAVTARAELPGPGSTCEHFRDAVLGQPANAVTSLAFVVAGLWIAFRLPGTRGAPESPGPAARTGAYGLLVMAVGLGSVVQHGPHPPWQDLAHDLPLVALLAFAAVDAAGDLVGRRLPVWWWLLPVAALAPVIWWAPGIGDAAQVALGAVAVGLALVRAGRHRALRRRLVSCLVVLGAAAALGTLTRTGSPWCQPDSLWQGHAAWHILAAVALWGLAPAIGRVAPRRRPVDVPAG